MNTPHYHKDFALWLFGCIALLCLCISAPATFAVVQLFHSDGTTFGIAATIALLLTLEAGAVGCKLAILFVEGYTRALNTLCIAALGINTLSNLVHGAGLFSRAQAQGLMLTVQLSPWLFWPACIAYAGLAPVLLYICLTLAIKRVQKLRGDATDVQRQVQQAMLPVQQTVEQFQVLVQAMQRMQLVGAQPGQQMQLMGVPVVEQTPFVGTPMLPVHTIPSTGGTSQVATAPEEPLADVPREAVDAPQATQGDTTEPAVSVLLQLLKTTDNQSEKRRIRKQLRSLGYRLGTAS